MTVFESDLRSLAPEIAPSRRTIMVTSLATGFAMAVQPIAAQTAITTDAAGLEASEVKIPTQDGSIPAYRAMPASGGPFPVVLVVQEIFGVHEHIKDVCRRLAKLGTLAVAFRFVSPRVARNDGWAGVRRMVYPPICFG